MRDIVLELLSSYGYAGMFALILIENLFPPIPSEVILTFGGFMTTYTRMNIAGAVLAATAGSVLGALILYELGRHIPVQKFYAFLGGAWGKRLGVEVEDVKDADGWLERTGRSAVFFCRFVPIIRSLISIPAGMAKMELLPFLLLTTAGSLIWNTVLIGAGAVAGASWEEQGRERTEQQVHPSEVTRCRLYPAKGMDLKGWHQQAETLLQRNDYRGNLGV